MTKKVRFTFLFWTLLIRHKTLQKKSSFFQSSIDFELASQLEGFRKLVPPGRSSALPRALDEGPVDADVLAQHVGTVELVFGRQGLLVRLVLDKRVALEETWKKGRTLYALFHRDYG